jgi:hypothetical protein
MDVSGQLQAPIALPLRYPLRWWLGESQSQSGRFRERKKSILPLPGMEGLLGFTACSVVTITNENCIND